MSWLPRQERLRWPSFSLYFLIDANGEYKIEEGRCLALLMLHLPGFQSRQQIQEDGICVSSDHKHKGVKQKKAIIR